MQIFIFITGLFIGSFLNVCIYRIPREESIVFPGSHCPSCGTPLKMLELVPVFSWVWLRGKCRTCDVSISPRYPFIELLTALLFLLVYYETGFTFHFILISSLSAMLLVMTMIDLDHQIIPDGLTILIAVTGMIHFIHGTFDQSGISLMDALLGVLIGGGFFLFIAVVSKGGMGGGDIKLMAALGLWFGWRGILLVMFLSFIIGGIFAVGFLVLKQKGRKEMVPFGPFIAAGAFLTALYGQEILYWYFSRFIR